MSFLKSKLTKEQILAAQDCAPVAVETPEWGGTIYVRPMTAAERDRYTIVSARLAGRGREIDPSEYTDLTLRLLALTICDEEGKLVFSEADIKLLAAKSGEVVDRVFRVAQSVNGIGGKAVAAIAKNSGPSPSANSHSA